MLVVGEASGDAHAARVITELKKQSPNTRVSGIGGDNLRAAGMNVIIDFSELAVMGLLEVLKRYRFLKKIFDQMVELLKTEKPDLLVLVDYPGFNLKIAKFAKLHGIKVFYYISPKVWAWNKSRVTKIKRYVDELLVIFPFEVDFYQKYGMKVTYVGNPLLDEIGKGNFSFSYSTEKPIIALLPGSRKQEIEGILPEMLRIVSHYPNHQFVIAATNNFSKQYYHSFIKENNIKLVFDETYGLLSNATVALVTSGTATLETALFKVPQVVCYKTNWLTYFLAKKLIKIKYLSLVNILMDKLVVKELIQKELNKNSIKEELDILLNDNKEILTDYDKLSDLLNKKGASKNAAQFIIKSI